MTKVGSLVIDLIAETASFQANMKRAAATLNSEASQMRRALAGIQSGIDGVISAGKAFAGAAIVGEISRLANSGLEYASSLGEVSQQLGVTAQDLQVYRYAATQVGVSQEEMDKGLQKLTRSLGQAQLGNKQMLSTFGALGVAVRTADGQLRSTSEVLPDIERALGRISDPARRAAVETQLFGRAGQQLDTLLSGGSDAVDELRNAAQRLGLVLSDDAIANADATADKLSEVKQVLEARIAAAVAENADAVDDFAESLIKLVKAGSDYLRWRDDVDRGADKVWNEKGMMAWATTSIDDFRSIGAGDRYYQKIMDTVPEGLSFKKARQPSSFAIDELLGGGSSQTKKEDPAKKLTEEYNRQLAALNAQLKIDELRREGDNFRAGLMESEAAIVERLIGLDKVRLDTLKDQNFVLQQRRAVHEEVQRLVGGNEPIKLKASDGILRDILDKDQLESELREIAGMNKKAADATKLAWVDGAQGILYSMDTVARGIKGQGGILETLSGLLDLFMSLGSIGLFGGGLQTNIAAARGFSSGGYTGNLGTSDIAGVVHGQEYVFDAAAVRRIGLENLERMRRGNGFMRGGYTGGGMIRALDDARRVDAVKIVPSPYFDAVVDRRAEAVAAPIGMRAATAGSSMAKMDMVRSRKNKIPSRF